MVIIGDSFVKLNRIYVLRLFGNRYYIGKSCNPQTRVQQHILCQGPKWTSKWLVRNVEAVIDQKTELDEDIITKKYMLIHGIRNVRGGSYSNIRLTTLQLMTLQAEFDTAMNKCYMCGGLFVMNHKCKATLPLHIHCYYCAKNGHRLQDCPLLVGDLLESAIKKSKL